MKVVNKVVDSHSVVHSLNTAAIGRFSSFNSQTIDHSARSARSSGPWFFSYEAKNECKHNLDASKITSM